MAGFFSRRMAKTALPVASAAIVANGLQGTYLHARGIAQKPGGWRNARYNMEMGPPLLAPLLVTLVGGMGLLAVGAAAGEVTRRRAAVGARPVPRLRRPGPGRALGPGHGRRGAVPDRDGTGHPVLHARRAGRSRPPCATSCSTSDGDAEVPVVNLIDARLAEQQTDGWRYDDMPEDGQAWRDTLAALDSDARDQLRRTASPACAEDQQAALIQAVQDLGSDAWHGLPRQAVWSLWTRYACTAFYAHPSAWNEIGFPGPAYPRGYKNPGVDRREPFEVRRRQARPTTRRGASDEPASGPATSRPGCCPTTAPAPTTGCARTCAASPTPTRSTWSSSAAAPAARRCCSGWPARGWRVAALDAGPFWDPDTDWVSDEAGSHHLYWTEPRVIAGADPVPLGSNNSGRGVGGSMVHYAGYTPRFHPSDFETFTRDGVGADWPLGYARPAALLPGDRGGAAGRRGALAVGRPARLPAPAAPGRRQRRGLPARRRASSGITAKVGPVAIANGRFGNRPHCIYRGFCLQGCKVNAKASPLITHIPDALAHGAEVRADAMVTRVEIDQRTGRATGVHYVRGGVPSFQRARMVAVAGYSIETPRLLLNSASTPVPRRPVQRLRPGRPLPHGAGRAADRGPLRRRGADVQGAAARGQQRGSSTRPTRPSPTSAGSPSRPSRRCRSPGPSTSPRRATGAPRCAST